MSAVLVYDVLRQVRPLYQTSARAVEAALQGTGLTVASRAVLELLLDHGPMTVPQVAQELGVTRQSIQTLVDAVAADGLLGLADNPRHRRSRLVAVTDHGRRTFEQVHRRELENLRRVAADLDDEDLVRCTQVLATLTARLRRLSPDTKELP